MSLNSSSCPPENSINLSTTNSIWVCRRILISWPRLSGGQLQQLTTEDYEHTYHLTAWFFTSDILSSTSDRTVFNTLFSTGSSPWKEAGSCLISVIRSFRPMNLSLIASWWKHQEWNIFSIYRKSWSGDCIWNYGNEINWYWENVSRSASPFQQNCSSCTPWSSWISKNSCQ